MLFRIGAILTLAFAAPASESQSVAADDKIATTVLGEFGAFLERFRKEKSVPALSAVVLQDGEIIWEEAYGFSDDEGEIPATLDTTYKIASVTKPIAATAILREAAENRVRLDTPLTSDPGWQDTCEWLAGSKIPFGGGGRDARGVPIPPIKCDRSLTLADVMNMRVNGAEGSGFVYNPISFARIDRVIEGAGGRSLRRIVRQNILVPAGIKDVALGWRDPDGGAALRLIAPPFKVVDGRAEKNSFPDDDFRAAGGIIASVRQLARFDRALDAGLLLPAERHRIILHGDMPGARGDYRWGWFVQNWRGHRLLWHSGWDEDRYSAIYLKVPDRRLTLIVLANTEALWWGNSLVRAEIHESTVAKRFLEAFVR